MLDIHALQVFYEAAQASSFTAAAHALNMTQPAVSMQIKSLEDQLQVKLFERNGRTMQLTKAGQALMPHARQLIELSIRTEEFIRTANDAVLGDLVIGCSLPSANEVLIHLAANFQRFYPLVRVRIPSVSQSELIDKIINGQYDCGIMHVVNNCDPLECQLIFNDQIVLVAPVGHPFIGQESIVPTDLQGQAFVCQGEGSACRYAVRDALKPHGVDTEQFDVRMEISNHGAIIAAVEHGVGLAFVSRLEAVHALVRGTLRIVPIEGINLTTAVGLGYSNVQTASLAALKFRAYVTHPRTQVQIGTMLHNSYRSHATGDAYA